MEGNGWKVFPLHVEDQTLPITAGSLVTCSMCGVLLLNEQRALDTHAHWHALDLMAARMRTGGFDHG